MPAHDRRKQRVGEVGNQHPDGVGAVGLQAAGDRVGPVAELVGGPQDALGRLLVDQRSGLLVERAGDGAGVDLRQASDVADRHRGTHRSIMCRRPGSSCPCHLAARPAGGRRITSPPRSSPRSANITIGGVAPGPACDRAARMRGAAGLVQPRDRHPVLGPARSRPLRAGVGQRAVTAVEGAVPHVRVRALQVNRRHDELSQDRVIDHVRRGATEMAEMDRRDLLPELPPGLRRVRATGATAGWYGCMPRILTV